MADTSRTTLAQLSIVGAAPRDRAANVRAIEPLPGSREAQTKGNLYLLIQLTGDASARARLYRQILALAQNTFYAATGSITSSLAQAIYAAHQVLQEHNAGGVATPVTGGMSAVALKGDDIYIAQGGPALTLVTHPRTVEQFPALLDSRTLPLGGPERPEVEWFHTRAETNTAIVLLESIWVERVPPEKLAAAAAAADVATVLAASAGPSAGAELSALVVTVPQAGRPVASAEAGGGLPAQAPPGAPGRPAPTKPVLEETERQPETAPKPTSEVAQTLRHGLAGAAGRLAAGARAVGEKARPAATEPQPTPKAEAKKGAKKEKPKGRTRVAFYLAFLIPLVAALLVVAIWWQRGEAREARYEQLVQGARDGQRAALTIPDERLRRTQLQDAYDKVNEALTLKSDSAGARDLAKTIASDLDRVNHVTPLYLLTTLREFRAPNRDMSRLIVVNGVDVYALDRGNDVLEHMRLNELKDAVTADEAPLARKGQQLANLVVGDLVDMVWVPAGGNRRNATLLILDSTGTLLQLDPTWGLQTLPISQRETWRYPQLVGSFNGNFYLLDPQLNQILRYRPTAEGFTGDPEPYFVPGTVVDMGGAVDLAIDGNIWILYANGIVQKFFDGRQVPFELLGYDEPLRAPTALFAGQDGTTATHHLYVADAGHGRITEFDKEGKFVRQFRLAEGQALRSVRSFFVDEVNGFLYFLTNDALYKTDLPLLKE
ncbi:MAG: hypothetical protein IT330_06055 [Anaerolineae bacterium]|nr:hypothetical protein [Anaerolineae bacterium]